MADKVIKEHYVPQRYLKHFSNGNKFFVYDKEKNINAPETLEITHVKDTFMMWILIH